MSTLEEVLKAENIEYIDKQKYVLARSISPDHEDNNPSFSIHKATGFGKCFSCGYTVNVFKLYNISSAIGDRVASLKEKMYLLQRDPAQDFPNTVDPVCRPYRHVSTATLKKFEAFTSSTAGWDSRVWFPLRNEFGAVISFSGRSIGSDVQPKIIFLPRGVQPPLLPAKPKSVNGKIILVEGIFDMLSLQDVGLTNVCVLHGLSGKNDKRIEALRLYGVTTIITAFDSDKAGRDAAKKFAYNNDKDYVVRNYELPDGEDWNSLSKDLLLKFSAELLA